MPGCCWSWLWFSGWYMVDYFFVLGYNLHMPSYIDRSHVWQIEVGQLPVAHPEYQAAESDSTALETNFARVMDRLQGFPGVEAVAVSFYGGLIGGGTYAGISFPYPADTTRGFYAQSLYVDPRYDYFRVYRLSAAEGRQPLSLHDYDWADPHTIVVCDLAARQLFGGREEALGKEITSLQGMDGPQSYVVRGVIDQTKRFPYFRPRLTHCMKNNAYQNLYLVHTLALLPSLCPTDFPAGRGRFVR